MLRVLRTSTCALGALLASAFLSESPAAAAALPTDLTGAEVCALAPDADAGSALAGTVTRTTASTSGTPQCVYFLKNAAGTNVSVTVAVQRAESDLGGKTGKKAYDYVLKQNKSYSGGAKFVKLAGVGKAASYADGSATNFAFALTQDGRVITIAGTEMTKENAKSIGKLLVSNLTSR